MLAIKNVELVLHDHYLPEAVLFVEDGKIVSFGEMRNTAIPEGCEVFDGEGQYLLPGLVDIHTHTYGTYWFHTEPFKAAAIGLDHGITTVMPAVYFSADRDTLVEQIKTIRAAKNAPGGENIGGLYMEAPYMNPKFGCDRESNPWCGPIKAEDYMPLLEAAGEDARAWVTAPEREGIEEFVKAARKANPSVVFTVGHSEASPAQIEKLIPYGLKIGTHHTNATGDLPKYPECRGVCVDETVNYHSDIYAELISDSRGIHVDPYMQRLVRKIKGDDRIILISDACYYEGPVPEGDYAGVTDICFDFAGEIAGSKLTLDVACRNFMKHTGASLVEVMKLASYNPCQALGLTDRGEIAPGKRADLILADGKLNVKKVFLNGKQVR